MERYHVRGSSWGHRTDGMDKRQKLLHEQSFLESCGANLTSKDVHWPMTLAIRSSLAGRSSGLRLRSAAANARRREKKIAKGYIKGDAKGGGKSGWERTAAPAAAAPAARGSASSSSTHWQWQPPPAAAGSSTPHWQWQGRPWQGGSSGSTWQWSTWSWQAPEQWSTWSWQAPDTDDESWGVWV